MPFVPWKTVMGTWMVWVGTVRETPFTSPEQVAAPRSTLGAPKADWFLCVFFWVSVSAHIFWEKINGSKKIIHKRDLWGGTVYIGSIWILETKRCQSKQPHPVHLSDGCTLRQALLVPPWARPGYSTPMAPVAMGYMTPSGPLQAPKAENNGSWEFVQAQILQMYGRL